MLKLATIGFLALISFATTTEAAKKTYKCLPDGITGSDIVSVQEAPPIKGVRQLRKITVEQELKRLKAKCSKGKLVDGAGMEIRFYKLQGCHGNQSEDDAEVYKRQRQELAELKKHYRVIEMTCNPSGLKLP